MEHLIQEVKPNEIILLHSNNIKNVLVVMNQAHRLTFYKYENQDIDAVRERFNKSKISYYKLSVIAVKEDIYIQAYSEKYYTPSYCIRFDNNCWQCKKIPNARDLNLPSR